MLLYKKRAFSSPRNAQKRKKRYIARFGAAAVFCIVVFVAVGVLSWLPEINIAQITVSGNATVSEEDVRGYVEKWIDGGYLGIFSRANVFLLQPHILEEGLRASFKKIKEVSVSRDSFRSLAVNIYERKPFYIWCEHGLAESNSQNSAGRGEDNAARAEEGVCYFLDINGYAFAPAPYFSGDVYFEFHKPFGEDGGNPTGTYFLPEAEFKRLIAFRNALREMGLSIQAFVAEEAGDYTFVLAEGTKIFFHPGQDFDILSHNLAATFDTEQFAQKRKRGFALEYIDLRFDNKVYYRFD